MQNFLRRRRAYSHGIGGERIPLFDAAESFNSQLERYRTRRARLSSPERPGRIAGMPRRQKAALAFTGAVLIAFAVRTIRSTF